MTRNLNQTLPALLLLLLGTSATAQVYSNIPAGTPLQVRIIEKISSETAHVGDSFHGTLAAPVIASGRTLFPKGAGVTGQVVEVERSGRLSNPGRLELSLHTLVSRGRTYTISAESFVLQGGSHAKSNVTKIGGVAAAGAIIGAIAGGGKGAAIGAGAGAAAGTGVAAATGKKPAVIESEAILTWVAANTSQGGARQAEEDGRGGDPYADDSRPYHGHHREDRDEDAYEETGYDPRGPAEFSPRERQIIRECMVDDRSGLPPGLAKKDRLPPDLERHLERNGTLPPGLQKRVQPRLRVSARN